MPVAHCPLCDFKELCEAQWERDDHPTRVANIRRDQIDKLAARGHHDADRARARRETDDRPPGWQPQRSTRCASRPSSSSTTARTGEHIHRAARARAGARVRAAAAALGRRPLLRHRGRPVLGGARAGSSTCSASSTTARATAPSGRTTATRSSARSSSFVDFVTSGSRATRTCTSTTTRTTSRRRSSG